MHIMQVLHALPWVVPISLVIPPTAPPAPLPALTHATICAFLTVEGSYLRSGEQTLVTENSFVLSLGLPLLLVHFARRTTQSASKGLSYVGDPKGRHAHVVIEDFICRAPCHN